MTPESIAASLATALSSTAAAKLVSSAEAADDAVLEYLAMMVEGEIEACLAGPQQLAEVVGDMLQSYEIVQSDSAALELCALIHAQLTGQGGVGKEEEERKQEKAQQEKEQRQKRQKDADAPAKLLSAPVNVGAIAASAEKKMASLRSYEFATGKKATSARAAAAAAAARSEAERREEQQRIKREAALKKKREKLEAAAQRRLAEAKAEHEKLVHKALQTYLATPKKPGMARDVRLEQVTLSSPDGSKELLHSCPLHIIAGRRYGLIGSNGVGKSTLLRSMETYQLDGFPTHLRVVHVAQEIDGTDKTVLQCVLEADVERTMLLAEEQELLKDNPKGARSRPTVAGGDGDGNGASSQKSANGKAKKKKKKNKKKRSLLSMNKKRQASKKQQDSDDDIDDDAGDQPESAEQKVDDTAAATDEVDDASSARLRQVYARLDEIDAWGAEARACRILSGLQFSPELQVAPTNSLSGGWRMRCALAAALFVNPDLLCLDEPTNHLDFPAVVWLEEYLRNYKKTLVLVSHDRAFVNNVITDVIHFDEKKLTSYRGNYDTFEQVRAAQRKQQQRVFEADQRRREHIQKFIDKFRYNAKRASLVQSRIKALARMEMVAEVVDSAAFRFEFPEPAGLNGMLVNCRHVVFGYDLSRPPVLWDINCAVDMGTVVGVIGANGAGKSTLIKLLCGQLENRVGRTERNKGAVVAVFQQHQTEALDLDKSPLEFMMEKFHPTTEETVRSHMGRFGITTELASQPIRTLSGGQKARLSFSVVTWRRPQFVIMDEPSNHLDLETIDALVLAITQFSGGVVVVSHDQHLLQNTCQEFWALSRQTIDDEKEFELFDDNWDSSVGEDLTPQQQASMWRPTKPFEASKLKRFTTFDAAKKFCYDAVLADLK
eukprot:TRINITY_DN65827_c5_g3_i2.p1 TRINITY_DN65827_c5_g3~~TRINITY_DN65827_c5_g3_i2.p1  ORF type:complete len:901 (+),score=494.79 TRINITY_DN65827_c5_g3_i2:34-2703(+)